jgi:hypothetical protein
VSFCTINAAPILTVTGCLKKIVASGVYSGVVLWIREFMTGRSQRAGVGRHYSEKVRVTSGVPQGRVLVSLLFLAYVNDIRKNFK